MKSSPHGPARFINYKDGHFASNYRALNLDSKVNDDDCEFYKDVNSLTNNLCQGKDEYLLNFGYKYCKIFKSLQGDMSE